MPLRITKLTHQLAVHWAFDFYDNHGEVSVKGPVEVRVRWEETPREVIGPEGSPISVDATVWSDTEFDPGGLLRLGALADLPSPLSGVLMEIIAPSELPDVKGRRHIRSVSLKRFNGQVTTVTTLPSVTYNLLTDSSGNYDLLIDSDVNPNTLAIDTA